MWPGEQPPGGEQNPHQPNPYAQQGFGQPNPYQQPGQDGQLAQPDAAQSGYGQQPGYGGTPGYGQQPQPGFGGQPPYTGNQTWGPASSPGGPGKPGGGNRRRNTAIALVASVAVVAAAVLGGVLLFDGSDDEGAQSASTPPAARQDKPRSEPSKADPEPAASDGSDPVTPGWQSVVNPKWFSAFDVPKTQDWTVERPGMITGFEDENGKMLVGMSAPAYFKKEWCKSATRAAVGTKGAQGSKNTKQAAQIAASNFAIAGFDQKQQGTLKKTPPKRFTNKHGITGHLATARVTGAPKEDKCAADGKVVAVSWVNKNDDLSLWVFYADANVKDEVPHSTVRKMLASLRDYDGGTPADDEPRG